MGRILQFSRRLALCHFPGPSIFSTRVKKIVESSTNSFDRVKDLVEISVGISSTIWRALYTFGALHHTVVLLLVVLISALQKLEDHGSRNVVSFCPCLSSFRPLSLPKLEGKLSYHPITNRPRPSSFPDGSEPSILFRVTTSSKSPSSNSSSLN